MPLHGDVKREYQRLWRRERIARMHEYLGGRCIVCGGTQSLQFHHRNPAKKAFPIMALATRRWEVVRPELDKCELRCRDCHKDEHAPKHGGGALYSKGCRCDLCVASKRLRRRNLRRRRAIDPWYGRISRRQAEAARSVEGASP